MNKTNDKNMIRTVYITLSFLFFCLTCSTQAYSQDHARRLTLEQALEIAHTQSPDALNAKQEFKASFWAYRTFRGTYLPQLGLTATLPDIFWGITKVPDPATGLEVYVPQQYNSYTGNLALTQKIGFTGGSISLNSGLQRTINRLTDPSPHDTASYLSVPVNLAYTQPFFAYNPFKWDRKIEPVKYDQVKRKYLEDSEQISISTTNYFFGLLQAQVEKKISETNMSNYDTLYKIAKGRYELGKIAENDLLLLELNVLKAQAAVENSNLALDNASFTLKSYLRIKDTIPFKLIPPANIDYFNVDSKLAIEQATANSSTSLDFKRRLLEAARDVNQAKMSGRFDAALNASVGLNQNANTLDAAYRNPLNSQEVSLGLTIPILDWGVARGKIKMAQSQEEVVKNSVEQDIIDFQRNVYLKVMQFNMQKKQLMIAAKSDTVARKTYDVTKGRYLIGKINSILDLNNAQINSDDAEISYYQALQTYWRTYFELRKQTLYDFNLKKTIPFDFSVLK
jgi:outer membrane protein TolC